MSERTQYAAGTFCWTDLSTTDPEAAKAFYSGLLGWEAEDMPVGDGTFYSMMRLGGRNVAAIQPQPPQQRDAGVPPVWNSYVSVQSADATAERAGALGATVHAPPFDVMEAGRMAVIQEGGVPHRVGGATPRRGGARERAGRAGLERAGLARSRGVGRLLPRPLRVDDRALLE